MFTGLVEAMGSIERVEPRPLGRRLRIQTTIVEGEARPGDSIAVNGCCLTAVATDRAGFEVETVAETLARTTLGSLAAGDLVNLERSMRLDQRLGGHLVLGHVDGVGEIQAVVLEGDGARVTITLPPELTRYVAEKGSLAVDGISLTVARVSSGSCEIALIPHTLAVTIAGRYRVGQKVNLEVDLVARYLARLIEDAGLTPRTS